jgi:DNA-binding transcriptional LysR family regulator
VELDQLRAFVAVAEAGGFSRAARVVASTQPTLSRQVGALERELGRPLLDRLGRQVTLTAYGTEVLDRARTLLSQADALAGRSGAAAGELSGELRLGVADSVILSRFPPILERFKRKHGGVTVHISTATSPQILAWVRSGRCDAGLCMLPEAHPGLVMRPLWTDRFSVLVQPCHVLADQRVTLGEFAAQRQMVIAPGTLSHQALAAAWQAEGLSLNADMDFDNFSLIAEFVAAGVGVGVVSADVAKPFLESGRVARVKVEPIDRLRRRLGLALHKDHVAAGPLGALIDEIDKGVRRRKPAR